MMNERHFNIGDIVRIPISCIRERIKYMQREPLILSKEIVYSEDPLDQHVKARIIKCNDHVFKEDKDYNVHILDKNGNAWLTVYNVTDEEMHICENDQTNHFVNKLKPGDRVVVRASYFIDHCLVVPSLFNRYGTISAIKYETGPYEAIGTNVSYYINMDNGIDLTIDDPAYLIYDHNYKCYNNPKNKSQPHYNCCLPYDLLNVKTWNPISDAANNLKEFIDTKLLKKEKQMVNTSIYRVIFNDPATIILWNTFHYEDKDCEINGEKTTTKVLVRDKTVVKCAKGEKFNKYNGFCAAVTKHIFETNSAIQRIIQEAQDNSDTKKLVKEITKTGKKVKAQRENMKETKKK